MNIAIPVNDKDLNSGVCPSFGRAPYFLIYNTETKESDFLENLAANSRGGAGIKAAQTIVDRQVSEVILPRCGENAADVLKSADIKLYKTISEEINENIDAFLGDKLRLLSDIHEGFHNYGGN